MRTGPDALVSAAGQDLSEDGTAVVRASAKARSIFMELCHLHVHDHGYPYRFLRRCR